MIQKAKQEEAPEVVEIIAVEEITPESSDAVVTEVISDSYGPTKSSDTLWTISKNSNTYDDVSIEQMMMAIHQANPKAFYKDNVNALMAGQTLVIPEKEVILKLSRKRALTAFKKQNNEWNGRVAVKPKQQETVSDSVEIDAKLELKAPVESEIAETVIVVSEKDIPADSVVEEEKEAEALEISSNEETLALQARMEKLEQQLVMMQKLLVLKDEQIAALQNKRKLTDSEVGLKPEESTSEIKKETAPVPTAVEDVKPIIKAEAKVVEKPKVIPKPKPKPKPVVQPEPETGIMSNLMTLIFGGVGAVILGVLGWLWWRKRKVEEETDTESMFASASEISFPDSSIEELSVPVMEDDTAAYDVGTVGESSFLSEFTPSD
ncbi:MAG: LPXTG cell wall anchor domain-containing protein, partial [Methylococcales bacterium]|nr:LPXTG cell wall anchor domain-containing protein [Methylococcales bacterium]